MSRDHRRITVLFGREYEWIWAEGRLTLEPNFWQLNTSGLVHRGIRPWFTL
ncbi:hypothetical protein ACGFYQ_34055 [Streptomyces sp. NPDC048258]|uniref:hypothetical protein n=1 Tax=Streptomyces sp. NPDC048258 TaxID=3365527 RepID=UPI0037186625